KYVFPGGRLDPGDQRIRLASDLKPWVLDKLSVGITPSRARGLGLAAIRETFEETGILLGEHGVKVPRTRGEAWRKFFAHGIVPRLDVLDLVGRAITPPNRTRRFDARFFMAEADAIAHTLGTVENEELLEPCWLTFEEARGLDLMSVTRRMLDEVEARVIDGYDPHRPIPFFRFARGRPGLEYL
ncbi:MAG: NUDIX hydrolase, partial [Alphaproteobacteria bacterium]|nr:NUDIX hydrolase [Alphaproteobacteria bacterium]